MGAVLSIVWNVVQFRVTHQTISAIKECLETDSYYRLRTELLGSTREQRRELFRSRSLLELVQYAVKRRNLKMVRYLVQDCRVSPNLADVSGISILHLTACLGWYEGAMVLLRNGADISGAEMAQRYLKGHFMPILHLAVLSENDELIQELLRRGADINVKDSLGHDCSSSFDAISILDLKQFRWRVMRESQSSAGESFYDFSAAERLTEIHSCDECVNKGVLSCPRYETSSTFWLLDLKTEKKTAPKSVFGDILDVDVLRFFRTVHLSKDNERDIRIRSLLAIERHISQLPAMTTAVKLVVDSFLKEDKTISAVSLLNRHVSTMTFQLKEGYGIIPYLEKVMDRLQGESNLPCNAVLEFMATASRCLGFFTRSASFCNDTLSNIQPAGPCDRIGLNVTVISYLKAMNLFSELEVPASPEQLRTYHSYTKELVSSLPWLDMESFSPFGGSATTFLCSPSTIKTLVVCSAEVKGQLRLKDSPPHLAANAYGDTPLHLFAQRLSQEDLLDNGVLDCFLKHGADLCTLDRRGRSVRDILLERGILSAGALLPSLQCAAAAAFMRDLQLRREADQCGVASLKHLLLDHWYCYRPVGLVGSASASRPSHTERL